MVDTNYKIRAWMGANKVSGREMAERINMPYGTFRLKMEDRTQWKLSEIMTLLEVTGMKFDDLF